MAQITYTDKEALNVNPQVADINKVKDSDMNMIKSVVNSNETKYLLAVANTAPAQCSTGDMYFDTTDDLIYTATATDTWGSTGVAPTENTLYVVISTNSAYVYDGNTLVSVGGQVENTYSTSQKSSYSCDYINNHIQGDLTTNGSAVNCGYKIDNNDVYIQKIQKTGSYTGTQTIDLGLSGKTIVEFSLIGTSNDGHFVMPYINPTSLGASRGFYLSPTNSLVTILGTATFSTLDIIVRYY